MNLVVSPRSGTLLLSEVPDLGHELDAESEIWDVKLEEVRDLGHEFDEESQIWDMNLI